MSRVPEVERKIQLAEVGLPQPGWWEERRRLAETSREEGAHLEASLAGGSGGVRGFWYCSKGCEPCQPLKLAT